MPRSLQKPDNGTPVILTKLPVQYGGTGVSSVSEVLQNFGLASHDTLLDENNKLRLAKIQNVGTSVNIDGPTSTAVNTVVGYTITDHDVNTAYTITVSAGTVSRNGATITLTAPSTAQTVTLTINGKAYSITVFVPVVNQTSITSPTSGATGQGSSVSFTSGAFATTGQSDTHQSSDWQIATDVAFTNVVASVTASTANLTSWTASGLVAGTTYYARCRHNGTTLGYGAWSTAVSFSTKSSFLPTAQQAKLIASDGQSAAWFGNSVSLSGDGNTCAVGASSDTSSKGAVYIFTRSGATWTQVFKLIKFGGQGSEYFGYSVALTPDATRLAVGVYNDNNSGLSSGAAYIYKYTTGSWNVEARMVGSDSGISDGFGCSISINANGDTAVIGALGADVSNLNNAGAAYIFTRSGTTWSQQTKLTADPNGAIGASWYFGESVAISSDGLTIAVGSSRATSGGIVQAGVIHVFAYAGGTWSRQSILSASDAAAGDNFGARVVISANGNVVLGTALNKNSGAGAVYVFTRSGATWSQQAKLTANDAGSWWQFGDGLSTDATGTLCCIGATGADSQKGAVYTFAYANNTWTLKSKLMASDQSSGANFGNATAMSSDGSTCCVAAYSDDVLAANRGSAYIFA